MKHEKNYFTGKKYFSSGRLNCRHFFFFLHWAIQIIRDTLGGGGGGGVKTVSCHQVTHGGGRGFDNFRQILLLLIPSSATDRSTNK